MDMVKKIGIGIVPVMALLAATSSNLVIRYVSFISEYHVSPDALMWTTSVSAFCGGCIGFIIAAENASKRG